MHRLTAGDYFRWLRSVIKDEELPNDAAAVERDRNTTESEARARLRHAVGLRYTAPAEGSAG